MICSCLFTVQRTRSGLSGVLGGEVAVGPVEVPLVATADWTGEAFVDVRLMTVENNRLPWGVDDLTGGERDRLRATLERHRDEQRAAGIGLAAKARAS